MDQAPRDPAAIDEDLLPERIDGVARLGRDTLHQRHIGGQIMPACGEVAGRGGRLGDHYVAGLDVSSADAIQRDHGSEQGREPANGEVVAQRPENLSS